MRMKTILKNDMSFLRLLLMLGLLNIIDAFLTLYLVKNGIVQEANPFMHEWLIIGTSEFLIIKLLLPTFCIYQLWRYRKHLLARALSIFATMVYIVICIMHFRIIYSVMC